MSKSLGNTVSPEEMIERYGADTVRLFILFAANPTAGMDWSDAALDANHRVMMQMRTMPEQLMAWSGSTSPMDDWLEARFTQRLLEFSEAMEGYDLRRAVELSHYEVIKDINWYVRRGGANKTLAERWLPLWAQMVSVSTPHMAEEWWASFASCEGLVSGSQMTLPDALTEAQQLTLSGEQYIRDVLEQARKSAWSPSVTLVLQPPKQRLSSRQPGSVRWPRLPCPSSAKVDIQNNSFPCCRNFRLLRASAREK